MIAIYNGEEFECSISKGKITIYSQTQRDDFELNINKYKKIVDRSDCDRVYRQEHRFLYKGKSFRYKDESDGKILLIDNSKNNGFELRLDYDEYGKWVNTSDGEKIIWTEEYWLHTKVPNNLYGLDENHAFKQSGEGIQYEFGFTILDLLKIKYLKEI